MTNRSEVFGRLLKAGISSIVNCEGKKAPIVEDELGQLIGVSGDSIQRYKAGHLPPEPRTIEILAEAAIHRGFLGREWLQRFLHAARYPFADKLLDQLCPVGPTRPRPPRIYENLPAPTYSQFVMRQEAFAEILDGLTKRSAAVLIVGLGGNGKTSLAREVADACLKSIGDMPTFDAAVWISDKDRPGTTNLSIVLDEIARTLDYPGFTQFEYEEKRREVEQLLKRQRVLIVVDNFETITDGGLLAWLLNLPEPSKVLITTREYRREFRRSSWPVDLRGMTDDEAKHLIAVRVRVLKIEKLVGDLTQLEPLLAATGGNPKALEMTLGLMKYEHRPLQQVVDDLYIARGELFDDLFTRAWALLDDAARWVLLAMTFFPTSASGEALSATADVQGFAFDRAVERLTDLALLDVQQADLNSAPRYALHPLVRAFSRAMLAQYTELERSSRHRWAAYIIATSSRMRKELSFSDLELLEEHDAVARSYLQWAVQGQYWTQTIEIYTLFQSLWSIHGMFDAREKYCRLALSAAQSAGNITAQVALLASLARLATYRGKPEQANNWYAQLTDLCQQHTTARHAFTDSYAAVTPAVMAFYANDAQSAAQIVKDILATGQYTGWGLSRLNVWLARCYLQIGVRSEARKLLTEVFADAGNHSSFRQSARAAIYLANIALQEHNEEQARFYIGECERLTGVVRDRRVLGDLSLVTARLHILRGAISNARTALADAIDLFERLGMRRELAEARDELAQLDLTGMITEPAESSADNDELSQLDFVHLVDKT